jgi:hypothetical protein
VVLGQASTLALSASSGGLLASPVVSAIISPGGNAARSLLPSARQLERRESKS